MANKDKKVEDKSEQPTEFVSKEEFKNLESSVNSLVGLITKQMEQKAAEVTMTPIEKEVAKAGPDSNPVNPKWEEMAREIIGEALDHCEITYPKRGGVLFTIVIKTEFSNAPKEYLARMGQDRRTREIGNDGQEGVEAWCKLVASNLKNTRKFITND